MAWAMVRAPLSVSFSRSFSLSEKYAKISELSLTVVRGVIIEGDASEPSLLGMEPITPEDGAVTTQ